MTNQDIHDNSLSGAVQRVVDSSQQLMLAHVSSLRVEVKEDLGHALSGLFLIGVGVILLNGAWLSLMAFTLQGLNDQLSLLASLAIVGGFTGLIGVGFALAGIRRLRPPKIESGAVQTRRVDSALSTEGNPG